MSGKEIFEIADVPISCFSFNKDRSRVAFSPNDHQVFICKKVGSTWEKEAILNEHHQNVTSIDWAPNSNRIVTCSADRNGFVWVEEAGKWSPTLVILRINRAATYVRWSPNEDKFAVASGARLVSVCYFEKENHWWVSKHIKKPIRSTVLAVDWHPNNVLLCASSTDFKARVFSAYIKEIEPKPETTNWGKKMPFGALMAEFSNGYGGWVHDVAFSPSGSKIAWVSHDSTVSVVQGGDNAVVAKICTSSLPFLSVVWVSENSLVTAGHDFVPMVFSYGGDNTVKFVAKLDQPLKNDGEEETISAMDKFRNLDKKNTGKRDEASSTAHVNVINQLSVYAGPKENVSKIASSGLDGKIVIWDIKTLEKSISELKIV
ncbi:actin-related protein 2/3 complex subunit 1A-A isoform X2 [Hydra vulgaris]|uniref:Actin-related protein 2/3 complex subunit n=1 Tax=Hydra vulgaris TaxID=6087 RepID=A0ABM4B7T2_HYDVU